MRTAQDERYQRRGVSTRVSQSCYGGCVASLAAFGTCPYVRVLIHMNIFQGCQGCQLFLPTPLRLQPWQPSQPPAGNKLALRFDAMGLVT
jgi:hypothetical protein